MKGPKSPCEQLNSTHSCVWAEVILEVQEAGGSLSSAPGLLGDPWAGCLGLPSASLKVPVSSWAEARLPMAGPRPARNISRYRFPMLGPDPLHFRLLFGRMALNGHPAGCED